MRLGMLAENTAAIRVNPYSTGSTYTMSAWSSPACGCALCVLSYFTTKTGLGYGSGSPVNGEVRSWTVGAGADTAERLAEAVLGAGLGLVHAANTSKPVDATITRGTCMQAR